MAVLTDQIKTESLNQQAFYTPDNIIAGICWKVLFSAGLKGAVKDQIRTAPFGDFGVFYGSNPCLGFKL